jgi:hypothetical protein
VSATVAPLAAVAGFPAPVELGVLGAYPFLLLGGLLAWLRTELNRAWAKSLIEAGLFLCSLGGPASLIFVLALDRRALRSFPLPSHAVYCTAWDDILSGSTCDLNPRFARHWTKSPNGRTGP